MSTTTTEKKPVAKRAGRRGKTAAEKAALKEIVGPRADAPAHDAKTLGQMIEAGSFRLRATGAQTAQARLDALVAETVMPDAIAAEPTPEQRERMAAYLNGQAPAGMGAGKSLVVWILTGDGIKPQAETGRKAREATEAAKKGATRSRGQSKRAGVAPDVQRSAELATEVAASKGKALSQRVAPKEIIAARKALRQIAGGDYVPSTIPMMLGFAGPNAGETAMRKYVTGETSDLTDTATAGVKALTKAIASHQVWRRKAAAAAFGIYLQAGE